MKSWLRRPIGVLYFLFVGALIVPLDFSSSSSVFNPVLNLAIRLLVAIGFTAFFVLLAHVLRAGTAESYRLTDQPTSTVNENPGDEEAANFEETPSKKTWSSLWSPSNVILALYCVAMLSLVVHSAILCEILWPAIAIFLWMPNPWQGSANQPEKYEILPRRNPR